MRLDPEKAGGDDYERRQAEDPDHPGIPFDTPQRAGAARILRAARLDPLGPGPAEAVFASREEVLTSANIPVLLYWGGEYARCLSLGQAEAEAALSRGQFGRAARGWSSIASCQIALGRLDEARGSLGQVQALVARVGQPSFFALLAQEQLALALDEGLDELAAALVPLTTSVIPALAWANGFLYAYVARTAARRGDAESALGSLARLVPWLERAPAWAVGFPIMACHAAETLWLLDHGPLVERCLRDKVVAPDFRSPMVDGRLALARVCALQGRHDEAQHWFTEARRVLTEQGARPLLAIADFDEAHMNARRTGHGDAERARPLLDTARRQFETIGMTGWFRRAEDATS